MRKAVVAGIAASFVVLVILIGVVQLVWARHNLSAGAADLNAAIDAVKSPAVLKDPAARSSAIADLRAARREFALARGNLDLWSLLLPRLDGLPKYGPQLAAASPAAATAYFATSSALDIMDGGAGLWAALDNPRRAPITRTLATTLTGGVSKFRQAASDAEQAMSYLGGVPSRLGSVNLNRDIAKLRRDVPRLRSAGMWLSVLPDILGESSPRRYLFAWENSAEIRPAGGFLGAVDLVTLRHGMMRRHFSGSQIEPGRPPLIRLPIPEALTTVETTWLFRDSNVSPSFPLTARLERWFYGKDTGRWVNGVIDFVDQGVPDVLSATGPIYLPQYKITVNAGNAIRLANHFASVNPVAYRGPVAYRRLRNLDTYRKQFLGYEFAAILRRIQTLPANRWAALGQAMATAIGRHDILLWDQSPGVEQAVTSSGADGRLKPANGDFLAIVDDNRSYNKIGPYVQESAAYTVDVVRDLWLDSSLTLRYHLNPSPSWMEGFGPGLGTLGDKHVFRDFVRVFVPAGAVVQPVAELNQAAPSNLQGRNLIGRSGYGLTQITGWFDLRPGQTKTLRIKYGVPANALRYGHFRQYRLTVRRQPGTVLRGMSVRIRAVGGVRLRFGAATSTIYRKWLNLSGDQTLTLGLKSGGSPNIVPIAPPTNSDPFIPTGSMPGLY